MEYYIQDNGVIIGVLYLGGWISKIKPIMWILDIPSGYD